VTDTSPDPIVLEVALPADPATAWRAITDPDEVVEWFAAVTPVDGIGSPYRIDFGDGSAIDGRVRALERGRRLSYTWRWAGEDSGPETLVTWEVGPGDDGGSVVRLTHDGWAAAGADETTRDDHADYWAGYLDELAGLFDTGADAR
jgi:uncharacterized protein YndB with AHSA1/START domain